MRVNLIINSPACDIKKSYLHQPPARNYTTVQDCVGWFKYNNLLRCTNTHHKAYLHITYHIHFSGVVWYVVSLAILADIQGIQCLPFGYFSWAAASTSHFRPFWRRTWHFPPWSGQAGAGVLPHPTSLPVNIEISQFSKAKGVVFLLSNYTYLPSGKLTITNIAMGNHHFQWENQLFLWPFSIVIVCLPEGIGFYRYLYTTASTVKLCQIDRIMSVFFSPKVHFFSWTNPILLC